MEEEQDIQSDIVKQKQLRDAQENKEFDREMDAYRRGRDLTDEQRKERLLDNAKLKGNLMAAIGFEGGVGVATDIATSPLLISPIPGSRPLYYGINYGVGYLSNLVAQKIRGEQELSQGEALAAGGFQTIPFGTTAKGFKGLSRAVTKGAAGGVVGEQVRVGIDEQRLLTPEEAATGAVVGGAFGGAVKGLSEGTDVLKNNIIQHVENDPYSKLWPYTNRLGLTKYAGTVGAMKTPSFEQGDLFGTPDAVSKNLPDFVVQTVRKDMPAYAKEVPDAYIDYNKMRNWFYSSESGGRKAVETLMTPVVPGTQISRGVKIDGKFGLRERELPKLRENFKPILKALGIDQKESASIHHIAALKATFGILHKVQFDSPLFRKTFDALLEHVPGLGAMEGNLMPVIGRATRTKTGGLASSTKQAATPHNIVHRFYSNIIGESGELFFKPEVLKEMVKNDAYRIEKAHELGRIIARSEEIVKEAQEIWRLAGSQENIHFDEIVNKLSQLDELGYKKLASTEYQTPLLSEMIKDVVLDIKVEKDQLRRLTPQSKKIVSGRTPDLVQARNLLADKKELLKTTKNPKQRKQLQQDIAELEIEIKGPPPKQGKLPLRGYTKKPK